VQELVHGAYFNMRGRNANHPQYCADRVTTAGMAMYLLAGHCRQA